MSRPLKAFMKLCLVDNVMKYKQCMIVRVTEAQVMYLAICKTCKRMKDGIARLTK